MGGEVDTFRIQVISIAGSIVVMLAILELVRRRRLREEYSFAWIAASILLVFFSLRRDLLEAFARAVGIDYPPSLLVLVAIIFGLIVAVHFSVKISLLERRVTRLAQELSMLKAGLETRSSRDGGGDDIAELTEETRRSSGCVQVETEGGGRYAG